MPRPIERSSSNASSMSTMTIVTEISDKEKAFAESSGFERPEQNIDSFSSFCLISNNISGPAMMGLPHVFKSAGILPTIVAIVIAYITSSLTGTLLADAVSSIPGNGRYHRNLDFSKSFKIVVGKRWAAFAELLFIMACMSQACSALVETAQSLDGLLASFLLGKTYAIQLFPRPAFLEWSPNLCIPTPTKSAESDPLVENTCEPFSSAGPVIFTLGYLLTAIMFLPFGTGRLQEAMIMQIISFVLFYVLLVVFYWEFLSEGLTVHVPWVGNDVWEVPGVILFNYAFSITVPSWLNEKHPDVSINKVVWASSTFTSIIYVTFGLFAAMAFKHTGEDILVLLSSDETHVITRVCSALFGVAIIGCGVPIFCIMIKNSLFTSGACDMWWAYFGGALLPYILSMFMYQGKTLLVVLDWTGIVVNGLVAFVLPLILATRAFDRMMRDYNRRLKLARLEKLGIIDLSEAAVAAVLAGFDIPATSSIGEALRESQGDSVRAFRGVDSSSSSSVSPTLSTTFRSTLHSSTENGEGYGAVTTADAAADQQPPQQYDYLSSSTSYATKALKAILLFPHHVYKSLGGSSGHKHHQHKEQRTNKYHALVGPNPDTESGDDETKSTLVVPPRQKSQSLTATAVCENRYNDFDDYSEEDAVEEQYGVDAEDKDAEALDNDNATVLVPATSQSIPTNASKVTAKTSTESKVSSMTSLGKPVPSHLAYNAQKYLSSPSSASVREQQEALQRFAVFAHKKLPYNYNIVQPLPSSLEPYRRLFLVATTWMFAIIIVVTMTEKIIVGCLAPDDR